LNTLPLGRTAPLAKIKTPRQYIQRIYNESLDVWFDLDGPRFEGLVKAAENLSRHQVSFEKACEVFFDPLIRLVDASAETEAREAAVGLTEDCDLLFVVHMVRHEEMIRIISARLATSAERREYENE